MTYLSPIKNVVFNWFQRKEKGDKPELTVPQSFPLSPCHIQEYIEGENGSIEENKGYIPVSLLIKAIEDKNLLNIAVTGNYGVGKSSVIGTATSKLKKRHQFIDITLASLQTIEKQSKTVSESSIIKQFGNDGNNKKTLAQRVTDTEIEYSILQQILYHERPQATPKSRIHRIHKTRWWKPLFIAFCILSSILSIILLCKPSWASLDLLLGANQWSVCTEKWVSWSAYLTLTLLLFLTCWYVGKHYGLTVSKIGYKSVELKVKEDVSVFNAYLDEIVYFFESTDYDVVIFEDLDRFEDRDVIFYKLRELNTILNNSDSLKNRRIKFVYAVLDELFDAVERVKFFDYIISVIPVVDSLNSYNMLKNHLPKEDVEKLGRSELLNLCDYFEDMRLLLNIINEYNQYKTLIDPAVENMKEKILFGLIVYKNYVPSDFAKMYNRHGVVATVIDGTTEYRKDCIRDKEKQIESFRGDLKQAEKDKNEQIVSLRKRYLDVAKRLTRFASYDVQIELGNDIYIPEKVAEDESLFAKVQKGEGLFIMNSNSTSIPSDATINTNLGQVGYLEQLASIAQDFEMKSTSLSQKIERLESDIAFFPKTISGVYRKEPDLLNTSLTGLSSNQKTLVKFLLLNGYLDYDYQHYISYFYSNSIKHSDRAFVMNAARSEGIHYETQLIEKDEVMKRFSREDFEMNRSLLNVGLTDLIFSQKRFNAYKPAVVKCVKDFHELAFILSCYRSKGSSLGSFFTSLLKEYDFWDEIEENKLIDQDDLRIVFLSYCDLSPDHLNSGFKSWLGSHYTFFDKHWNQIKEDRAIELFDFYKPEFEKLVLTNTPMRVVDDIIEYQRYKVNKGTFSAIIGKKGLFKSYREAPITVILNSKNKALINTLKSNWALMMMEIFPRQAVHEDEFAQISLLNDPNLPKHEARLYLSKQKNHVKYVNMLDDSILSFAFDYSLVEPRWESLYYYALIKHFGIPTGFLEKNYFLGKVSDSLSPEKEIELRKLIVFSNDLDIRTYKRLVPAFSTPFETVEGDISSSRMKYLVENNFLVLNTENYAIISRFNFSKVILNNNLQAYLADPMPYPVTYDTVISVLDAIGTKKGKCDYIRSIKEQDIEANKELSDIIIPLLLNGDLKTNDINEVLLVSVIKNTSKAEDRVNLGRRAVLSQSIVNRNTISILKAMGGDYLRFASSSVTSKLPYDYSINRLSKDLLRKRFLSNVETKDGFVKITKNHTLLNKLLS